MRFFNSLEKIFILISIFIFSFSIMVFAGSMQNSSYLTGVSASMGGSLLALNSCETATATITGATVGSPVEWSTSDGSDRIGLGLNVHADVTAANTVTIKECALVAVTPASKTFNVRILP